MTQQTALSLKDRIDSIRNEFPILQRQENGRAFVYLDNAATSQKPRQVIEAMSRYYERHNANVHRGVHLLSQEATDLYEGAREKVRRFINAGSQKEIVFVRGTTEAINLVSQAYGRTQLQAGDEILISHLEHHSNIVPWQILCEQTGAVLRVIPIDDRGVIEQDAFREHLGPKTKILAIGHISNALGTVNPIKAMIAEAKTFGAVTLVDGAQAAPHTAIDVQDLDCDFYTISGHKMFGPTGSGVLYGKAALLKEMPPWQGGGDMIKYVAFDRTIYNELPYKFEAGTPAIAEAIGLGAAIDYMKALGMDAIEAYEAELLTYATIQLEKIDGLRLIGTAPHKAGVLSFVLDNAHPHDVGTILSHEGVAIRTGHHCAQPVMARFKVPATARASLAFYNHRGDIDRLVEAIQKVREVFA